MNKGTRLTIVVKVRLWLTWNKKKIIFNWRAGASTGKSCIDSIEQREYQIEGILDILIILGKIILGLPIIDVHEEIWMS